jgi:hypothetical protein
MMLTLLLAPLLIAAGPEFQVQTLDGRALSGSIVELTGEQLVLQTADAPVTLPTSALLSVAPAKKPAASGDRPGAWVELTDGTQLVADDFRLRSSKARVRLPGGGDVEVPQKAIAAVRLKSQDPAQAAQWEEIRAAQTTGDVLIIRKGDALDYLEGALGDIDAETVKFKLDGELSNVKRSRVEGFLYFHPAAAEAPTPQCRMTDAGGQRIQVGKVTSSADKLKVVTPAGVTIETPWERITRLDFSAGKIVYLSELTPETSAWTPYFSAGELSATERQFYRPRSDRNLDGEPLSVGGKKYARGLALHSRTELAYRLPGKFGRFQAVVGIDDGVQGAGAVHLRIEADGRPLFDGPVAGGDAPRELDLDLTGAKRLSIVVDFGEGGDEADHLDLCDARIIK